jgi:hypothetical protein
MISNNLKSVGLNINAAPTSFDTIVARAFTAPVDYDIYMLGWSLGIFPEGNLCSFFCTSNDVNINPAGSNSAGYSDAVTDNLIQQELYTVDTTTRQGLIQRIESRVVDAIPWNVLYYRKSLNAFRNDRFQGWITDPVLNALAAGGGAYNYYSLVNLQPAGTIPVAPPSGVLTVATTVPQRLLANRVVPVQAFVSQSGAPVSGATVSLQAKLPSGTLLNSASGLTATSGYAIVNWTVPVIQGQIFLTVTATKGASSGTTQKQLEITVGPPAPIATLSMSTPTPVILAGGSATVTAMLVNGQGAPISGQIITIDPTLAIGKILPTSAATDLTGKATFTYTAPPDTSLFPNAHLVDVIRANVTVASTILGSDTQTATQTIVVQNNDPEKWLLLTVSGTPNLVLTTVNTSSSISVRVKDSSGAASAGITVTPSLARGERNVTIAPLSAVTDPTGSATFTVTLNTTLSSTTNRNVLIRFATQGQLFATSDQVALLLTGGALPGYAARLSFTNGTLPYVSTMSRSTVSATVYNNLGQPAVGAAAIFQIGYGDLGLPAEFDWTLNYVTLKYLGQGLPLNAFGLGSIGGAFQNSTGQGSAYGVDRFVNDARVLGGSASPNSCSKSTWPSGFIGTYHVNSTSLTNSTGRTSASFFALPMPRDTAVQVIAYIGNSSSLRVDLDACGGGASILKSFFRIDSGVVVQRAPVFGLGSITSASPIFDSGRLTTKLTAKFYKVGGAPAANAQVFLVRGSGSATVNVLGKSGGTMKTDATGTLVYNATVPFGSLSQAYYFALLPADPAYAYGGREQLLSGTGNPTASLPGSSALGDYWSSPTNAVLIAKFPFNFQRGYLFVPTTVAFATALPLQPLTSVSGTTPVIVLVQTGNTTFTPVAGASVWSASIQTTTDKNGVAIFNYTTGLGAAENLVVVTTTDGQVIRAWFGVIALNPILSYGTITPTLAIAGQASAFSTTVTNTLPVAGTATVLLVVDNVTVGAKTVTLTALGTATVTFSYVFTSPGQHAVTIGTQSIQANVQPGPATLDQTLAYGIAGGLLVAGLVVGAVVGLLLSRRGKKPPRAKPEETESPKGTAPSEEELEPGDEL